MQSARLICAFAFTALAGALASATARSASHQTFIADVQVERIPSSMPWDLPTNYYLGEGGARLRYRSPYTVTFSVCDQGLDCLLIQAAEDCRVTGCTTESGVRLAPEQAMKCGVWRIAAYSEYWPCNLVIGATRDTMRITGTTRIAPIPEVPSFDTYVATSYINGRSDPDLGCIPARRDTHYFAEATTLPGGFRLAAALPAGDTYDASCPAANDGPIPEMEAAIDMLGASLTFTDLAPSPVVMNQYGLTGTWFNPNTAGEGFILEEYPSINLLSAGWFTYDTRSGGVTEQRWYVLTGGVAEEASQIDFSIGAVYGGNFGAASAGGIQEVGRASLRLDSCTLGTLSYSFDDGREGQIRLTRFTENLTCTPNADQVDTPAGYLLSGNWADPDMPSQGIQFEFNANQRLLFAPWYTYAPAGVAADDTSRQRWYTLQLGEIDPSATEFSEIPIYSTVGGVFDSPEPVSASRVGTASLQFHDCGSATLRYEFSAGENVGLNGEMNLARVGPIPQGCAL